MDTTSIFNLIQKRKALYTACAEPELILQAQDDVVSAFNQWASERGYK